MIKLGGIISGTGFVREAADDKYVHIGYGKYKEKGKEKDSNAPTFKKMMVVSMFQLRGTTRRREVILPRVKLNQR